MSRSVAARGIVLGLMISLAAWAGAYAFIGLHTVNRKNHNKVKPPFGITCSGEKVVTVTVTLSRGAVDRFGSATLEGRPGSDVVLSASLKLVKNKDGSGTILIKRTRKIISKTQLTIHITAQSYGGDLYHVDLGSYAAGERSELEGPARREERAFAAWVDGLLWNRGWKAWGSR